jgi:hypothetical protein
MERDAQLQRLFYISFRVPSKGTLPPKFPSQSFHREMLHLHSLFQPFLKDLLR